MTKHDETKRVRISTMLAPAGIAKLDEVARRRGVTRNEVIRLALRLGLEKADYELGAQQRAERAAKEADGAADQ